MQTAFIKKDVAALISDKVDFKTRSITQNKVHHLIMIKELMHQKYNAIVNQHASNNRATKYLKQNFAK
jgi:hypothetical protein